MHPDEPYYCVAAVNQPTKLINPLLPSNQAPGSHVRGLTIHSLTSEAVLL